MTTEGSPQDYPSTPRLLRRLPRWEGFRFGYAASIFLVAVILRSGFAIATPIHANVYDNEIQRVGRSLAKGSFSGPYSCETGPTAIVPPGYPALLAPIYRWSTRPEIPIGILNIVASSATYALLPSLAAASGLNPFVGILAGFIGAVVPYSPGLEARGSWGEPVLTLLLVIALIATVRIHAGSGILCGWIWGLVFLVGPQAAPVCAVLFGYMFLRGYRRQVLTASILVALTVSPWIVRNYIKLGHLFWIRSGAGLEFYLSNNPEALATFDDNLRDTHSYWVHPSVLHGGCQMVQKLGEVEYFNQLGARALSWIGSNLSKFIRLTIERTFYFWFPAGLGASRGAFVAAITLMGLGGTLVWLRRRVPAGVVAITLLVFFPLFYYLIQANSRYRAPIQPVLLLGTAEVLLLLASRRGTVTETAHQTQPRHL